MKMFRLWCMTKLFQERYNIHTHLLTSERNPVTNQRKYRLSPKSNLLKQCVLLGLLAGVWMKGYLQEQKLLKDSCITKTHSTMGDSSQKLKSLEHTPQPVGSSQVWRASFPSYSVLNLFQPTQLVSSRLSGLVSKSSLQLYLPESLSSKFCSFPSEWEPLAFIA